MNGRPIKCGRRLCKKRRGEYCFACDEFPCDSIKRLDKRYRERYGMSVIENLKTIKEKGLTFLLESEKRKWVNFDGVLCVHDNKRY